MLDMMDGANIAAMKELMVTKRDFINTAIATQDKLLEFMYNSSLQVETVEWNLAREYRLNENLAGGEAVSLAATTGTQSTIATSPSINDEARKQRKMQIDPRGRKSATATNSVVDHAAHAEKLFREIENGEYIQEGVPAHVNEQIRIGKIKTMLEYIEKHNLDLPKSKIEEDIDRHNQRIKDSVYMASDARAQMLKNANKQIAVAMEQLNAQNWEMLNLCSGLGLEETWGKVADKIFATNKSDNVWVKAYENNRISTLAAIKSGVGITAEGVPVISDTTAATRYNAVFDEVNEGYKILPSVSSNSSSSLSFDYFDFEFEKISFRGKATDRLGFVEIQGTSYTIVENARKDEILPVGNLSQNDYDLLIAIMDNEWTGGMGTPEQDAAVWFGIASAILNNYEGNFVVNYGYDDVILGRWDDGIRDGAETYGNGMIGMIEYVAIRHVESGDGKTATTRKNEIREMYENGDSALLKSVSGTRYPNKQSKYDEMAKILDFVIEGNRCLNPEITGWQGDDDIEFNDYYLLSGAKGY